MTKILVKKGRDFFASFAVVFLSIQAKDFVPAVPFLFFYHGGGAFDV